MSVTGGVLTVCRPQEPHHHQALTPVEANLPKLRGPYHPLQPRQTHASRAVGLSTGRRKTKRLVNIVAKRCTALRPVVANANVALYFAALAYSSMVACLG